MATTVNHFVWPVRVYYEDTDSGGVVYHANYLKFMERARTEWLRCLGYEQDALARDVGVLFVVRSISVDYHRPARFNDRLEVVTSIEEFRGASLAFQHTIQPAGDAQTVLVTGQARVACIDPDTFHPKAVPAAIIRAVFGDG